MTLIVTLQGTDGLVLAADSRGTIGDPRGLTAINDTYTKLFRLSEHCGIGISGASELAAKLVEDIKAKLGNQKYVDGIMEESRRVIKLKYDDWFSKFKVEERPALNVTIAGFQKVQRDPEDYAPKTFMLSSQLDFAPQLFPNGNSLSGVPQYAIYLMNRFYSPEMKIDSLVRLAAYLIAETATQDPKVGGPIRIATLTVEKGYAQLPSETVDQIIKLNNEQNEGLKRFFFGEVSDEGKE